MMPSIISSRYVPCVTRRFTRKPKTLRHALLSQDREGNGSENGKHFPKRRICRRAQPEQATGQYEKLEETSNHVQSSWTSSA